MMLEWYVVSLALLVQYGLYLALHTVRGLVQSGWFMSCALGGRRCYLTVRPYIWDPMAVAIVTMLVLRVTCERKHTGRYKSILWCFSC